MSAYVPYAVITGDKLVSPRDIGSGKCLRAVRTEHHGPEQRA